MDTTEISEPQTEVAKADNYTEFYFNHAQVGFTAFDIYAYLGNMRFTHDRKSLLTHQARIVMSPAEAKLFYRFLGNAITQYEESFAEITVPKGADWAE